MRPERLRLLNEGQVRRVLASGGMLVETAGNGAPTGPMMPAGALRAAPHRSSSTGYALRMPLGLIPKGPPA